jgi:hypothetical protein
MTAPFPIGKSTGKSACPQGRSTYAAFAALLHGIDREYMKVWSAGFLDWLWGLTGTNAVLPIRSSIRARLRVPTISA